MRILLLLIASMAFTAVTGNIRVASAQDELRLVLESHVGARPRDADYLLAPLLDELKKSGFQGSSVTGTRIHSQHSISSDELSSKQIAEARQLSLDAYNAFVDLRFEGALNAANRAIALLLSRPATMARQQELREYFYDSLILASMAHARLGNATELEATMTEFIRSFPKREVSNKKYGPEGEKLFRRINKHLQTLKKGELQIAAAPGATVYINEEHQGIGSQKVKLYPGRYRVFTQIGAQAGRVHIVDITAGRAHTLVVDPVIDSALRTSGKMVGFVFEDEATRAKHEKRVALELGRALGADEIVLVGFHKFKGKDSIVASTIKIEQRETGVSARVPLPSNGAPSASQLRSLAQFVAGSKPANADIQVLNGETPIIKSDSKPSDDTGGISPVWRWSSWALGATGVGFGAYLIAIHDTGTCDDVVCPENYDTIAPGIGLVAGGAAVGLLGFYLWTKEADDKGAALSVLPTQGGFHAALSGTF